MIVYLLPGSAADSWTSA